MIYAATNFSAIGFIIAAIVAIATVVLFFFNSRTARRELGAEIELAPNRKPYYSDAELETKKLDVSLSLALGMLAIIAVSLPLYWLAEPGRQDGASANFDRIFTDRGGELYESLGCADCHGADGAGGGTDALIFHEQGDEPVFRESVNWKAPALDTILSRYSEEEVRYVLNYGRPGSPMAAWGTPGGGPLTTQQVDNLIDFLRTIQVQSYDPLDISDDEDLAAEQVAQVDQLQAGVQDELDKSLEEGEYESLGEAVFNLGYDSSRNFAAGGYGCGRCHTKGWSVGLPEEDGGGGNLGFSLRDGATIRRFPNSDDHFDFIFEGSDDGAGYGSGGQGSGRMPGFGNILTGEQICAVVVYERNFDHPDQIDESDVLAEFRRSGSCNVPYPEDFTENGGFQSEEGQ
ncbi:MAG: c-type cytochrome [Actinomycetia bacterium]|nr:c-type cytochrome [Actinomycetes bacterium]